MSATLVFLTPWGALLAFVKGAEAFFGAGALLLISGLAVALGWLRRLSVAATGGLESVGQLGARNTTRRRGRSLATITVLAAAGGMEVRARGVAMTDAPAAGRVKAQNLSSGRIVEGVVETADVIRITP